MLKKLLAIIVICGLITSPVQAGQHNPVRKLARGFTNFGLSWIEVPRQMILVNEESGDLAGVSYGALKGFLCFAGRLIIGAYEVGTCILPTYRPLIEPEFIFSEEEY